MVPPYMWEMKTHTGNRKLGHPLCHLILTAFIRPLKEEIWFIDFSQLRTECELPKVVFKCSICQASEFGLPFIINLTHLRAVVTESDVEI